jgi:Fis family transcriptional regulator, factor for inversion stimulation protein
VRDQLENLVAQMYQSGILLSEGEREFKKRFILEALRQNRGNQCKAARELGMHRNTLARTIADLKIDFSHCKPGYQRQMARMQPQPAAPEFNGALAAV